MVSIELPFVFNQCHAIPLTGNNLFAYNERVKNLQFKLKFLKFSGIFCSVYACYNMIFMQYRMQLYCLRSHVMLATL